MTELWFITGSYPYTAAREHTFIDPELAVVAARARALGVRVRVLPQVRGGELQAAAVSPALYELDERCADRLASKPLLLLDLVGALLSLRFLRGLGEVLRSPLRLRTLVSWELRRVSIGRALSALPGGDVVAYSYWFDCGASAAADLRAAGKVSRAVCRAHGWDLYEERMPHPSRGLDVARLDRVFCVSEMGARYLQARHPGCGDRVRSAYLGVAGGDEVAPPPASPLHVASCSVMSELKRVELIASAMVELARRHPGREFRWTHFGDGERRAAVAAALAGKPANLAVDLPGETGNARVLAELRQGVHVFVNASTSEGVPVSVMEALSCAVPVVATAVGGTPEAVDDSCGRLLPVTADAAALADALAEVLLAPAHARLREGARTRWQDRFDAEKNFRGMAAELLAGRVS